MQAKTLKFYVRRVFISDDFELLPRYLQFVSGVVDSDTLPLNIGRETLQHHSALKVIKKKLIRKTMDMIRKLADEPAKEGETETKYDKFYDRFGKSIKLGVIEDSDNRNRLAKLLRFKSTKSNNTLISLETYVSRMKEGQTGIYYLGGQTMEEVEHSPFVEKLKEDGYEVLLFADPLDEYVVTNLNEFDGKKMQDASKEDLTVGNEKETKKLERAFSALTKWWHKTVSAEDSMLDSVKVSPRLSKSPCVVVVTKYGYSPNMQRIMKAQTMGSSSPEMLKYMGGRRILEINPRHPIIQHIKDLADHNEDSEDAKAMAHVMYETALLESGMEVPSTKNFARRVYGMMQRAMDLEHSHESEPVDVVSARAG